MFNGANGVGKGDKPRNMKISQKEYSKRWNLIFNKNKKGKKSGS